MRNLTLCIVGLQCVLLYTSCGEGSDSRIERVDSAPRSTWIDLTHPFDSTTLYWPNNVCGFEHKKDFAGMTPGGYYYSSYSFCTPEHGGTHMDAPVHFAEGRQSVDQVPLSSITGKGIVVDVSDSALSNRDYLITVRDIQQWEAKYGSIPKGTIILFRTGYGKYYPDREKYFGTAMRGEDAIPALHFPGISPDLATWLVKTHKAKAVGLDTPSMDYGQSADFKTHRILLSENIPGFENVAHLDSLPPSGFELVALPMKITGGSGAPLRMAARILSAPSED